MFKKFYVNSYKSNKTISKEEAQKLKDDIKALENMIEKRQLQIEKFKKLIVEDPENRERYEMRIAVHKQFIKNELHEIEKIGIILLDS
jgi:predicted  nucleic acid-binding Zn-ribbon protein